MLRLLRKLSAKNLLALLKAASQFILDHYNDLENIPRLPSPGDAHRGAEREQIIEALNRVANSIILGVDRLIPVVQVLTEQLSENAQSQSELRVTVKQLVDSLDRIATVLESRYKEDGQAQSEDEPAMAITNIRTLESARRARPTEVVVLEQRIEALERVVDADD